MLRQARYALIVAAFALLASLVYVKLPFAPAYPRAEDGAESAVVPAPPTIQIANRAVRVDIADTPEERARGLGGRAALAEDEGMLFVFEEDGYHAFWMKDMDFPIDIVWISRDGLIAHIEENVGPETYPAAFAPRREARYAVELPAGFVERHGVRVGDAVRL